MTDDRPQEDQTVTEKRGKSSTERIFGADVISHGYTGVPNILVRAQSRLGISTTQFNIVVQLLSYWIDPTRPPFPPKRDLAQRMSITQQTLRINIKALEEKGYISRVQQKTAAGDYGSNIYRLDGLVAKIQELVGDFDEERNERRQSRTKTETPNARRSARRTAKPVEKG
ncbi:helix-turn-helix domain-containing protein [Agrobacterium tumefaciens]|uniref:helix-turn-helix domain-containing protein n=1 Tax=Agrobacterium tumefaciens TaxID=358 RepID=UPI001573F9E7|nr:helix-turn-helix domain-containing protein [Agrobacterium tumefaciens]NSZ03174.1 helix-turn-helix domain-containing protein [Agrobacterium tumefaciens]NSZ39789.1 helix-turn-helix domain-containing protein [Agrobacterium tumefaciens]NTB26747.1 helix-turn-helix domain-containing protein [Agrobacterium tumefaciens]NTB31859.1 helix-turn-helix domain-containing protein [Agrobacterium tumefaciens]NTB34304.1 helix-turn-helix domain-containing protein [Agrobacterium tumefaciens]